MYSQIDSNKRKTTLLIIIFIAFMAVLGYFLNLYLGSSDAMVLALIISLAMTLISYYKGDAIALASTGAKLTSKEENPYVYRMVENLAISVGMPTPKVYIINSSALNAFATGRDPEHASIAVTTGIIAALENEELEGVLAHELSHIKNYDIRVMTIVIVLVGAVSLISNMFFHGGFLGGRRRNAEENGGGNVFAIVGIVLLIISPIIAKLIQLAISRKREYLADASGALMTRYPEGLARALEKIQQSNIPLNTASAATAHLFISNPFKGKMFANAFSTHPPIEERIKRLREEKV